jgi:hypothetical protein
MDISTHVIVFVIFTIVNLSFVIWGVRKHWLEAKEKLKSYGKFASGIKISFMDIFFAFAFKYYGLPFFLLVINDIWLGITLARILRFYGY